MESGSYKREFDCLCVCHVLVERCWGRDQGIGVQTQGELNRTTETITFFLGNILVNRFSVLKDLACLLYPCKYIKVN